MSRTPGTIYCDLCGAVVADERRLIKILVPLTEEMRTTIYEQFIKPKLAEAGPFGAVLKLSGAVTIPDHWPLEACGCILGLVPMLPDLVTRDVGAEIRKKQARADASPLKAWSDL